MDILIDSFTYTPSLLEVLSFIFLIFLSLYISLGWLFNKNLRDLNDHYSSIYMVIVSSVGIVCMICCIIGMTSPISTQTYVKITDKQTIELLNNYTIEEYDLDTNIARLKKIESNNR